MTGPASDRGWGDRLRARWGLCAVVLAAGVWAGCTVTPENYRLYSFWFDGVPDTTAPIGEGPIRNSPDYSIHPPFAEGRCVDCHEGRFDLTAADPSVCMKCHEEVPESQPRMHGPVVTMACLWCHTPHESPYEALLKGPPREVCSQCHAPGMLGTAKTPEHLPESEASCIDCHQGHGGTVRYFLRPGAEGRMSAPPAPAAHPAGGEPGAATPPAPGTEPEL